MKDKPELLRFFFAPVLDESELTALIEAAKARFAAMTPEEREAELIAQRESWVRGETAMGEATRAEPRQASEDGVQRGWEDMQKREAEILRDYEIGNLTGLGVANYLRRAGFNSHYCTEKANSLATSAPLPAGTVTEEMVAAAIDNLGGWPGSFAMRAALEAAFAARPAEPVGVKVKPLEWTEFQSSGEVLFMRSLGLGARYEIFHKANDVEKRGIQVVRWDFKFTGNTENAVVLGYGSDLKTAYVIAQADYEQRMRAALILTPTPRLDSVIEALRSAQAELIRLNALGVPIHSLGAVETALASITKTGGAK